VYFGISLTTKTPPACLVHARESAQRTLENMLKMLKSEVQTVRILPAAEFERQKNVCPDSDQAVISDR
jgi:hypothetical protein